MLKIQNSAAYAAPFKDFIGKNILVFCGAFFCFLFLANGLSYVFGDSYEWVEYGSKGSWDYFWHHPRWDRPAFLLMHLLLFPLFGWNTLGYYVVHGLFYAAAMVILWHIARKLMSRNFALISVIYAATAFDTITWPFLFLGDAAGMEQTFVLIGVLTFMQYNKNKKTKFMLLSAGALFLAMAFKQPSRFIPFTLLLFLIVKEKWRLITDFSAYALAGAIFLASLFYQSPYHTISFHASHFINFGEILARSAALLVIGAIMALPWVRKKDLSDNHLIVFLWFLTALLQLPLFPHTEPRYMIGFMFPFTLLIFFLLDRGISRIKNQKATLVLLCIVIVAGLYPNLSATYEFVYKMKPYLVAKENTRLFLESNISNALVLYHWGSIDFFGKNNEYRNYNPAITGGANLSAYLQENRSIYIIHYPRKQPEIERIQNKTLYKKITNGPVEFWVWKVAGGR